MLQDTFCYGDVLLRRRFVEETFCAETFCMCATIIYPSRVFFYFFTREKINFDRIWFAVLWAIFSLLPISHVKQKYNLSYSHA
jgi:hypothetical protein